MMLSVSNLKLGVNAVGHYIEQPFAIENAKKIAAWAGLAGMAGIGAWDIGKASPEDRGNVAIRDTLVLGATALGTLGSVHMMEVVKKRLWNSHAEETAAHELQAAVRNVHDKSSPFIQQLLNKEERTLKDFKDLLSNLSKEDIHAVLPVHEEGFVESLGKCVEFALLGLGSVVSGLAGGLVAQRVNGGANRENTVNMVKEGVFQFIANIALCAVGAAGGIGLIQMFKNTLGRSKVLRTGIVSAGLSLGIVAGGAIANWIGHRWVNPVCDRMLGGKHGPHHADNKHEKRRIEFCDAILHLDDVPAALALAGVKVMEPFIPLFFAFSGYRTGIGYRNDHHGKPPHPPEPDTMPRFTPPAFTPAFPNTGAPTIPVGLSAASHPLYEYFRHQTAAQG